MIAPLLRPCAALAACLLVAAPGCASGEGAGRSTAPVVEVPPPGPSASAASPPPADGSASSTISFSVAPSLGVLTLVPPSGGACKVDADCVRSTCCHPSACVPSAQAPNCDGAVCTRECRAGTFDCGGGGCLCQAGQCAGELRERSWPKLRPTAPPPP